MSKPGLEECAFTVDRVAANGDHLKLKCFACERVRVFPAAKYLPRHAGKLVKDLRPRCDDCFRRRRRGPGLDQPGYCTAIIVVKAAADGTPIETTGGGRPAF